MRSFFPSIVVFALLFFSFMTHGGIGNNDYTLIPIAHEAEIYKKIDQYNHWLEMDPHSGEATIYGRITRSKNYGIFSDAGLLGQCNGGQHLDGDKKYRHALSCYRNNTCRDYFLYESQTGGQAFIYTLVNKIHGNPVIFRVLCASFLSAVLTSWFWWLCGYWGVLPSFLVMVGILSLRSLMLFGDNIAQVLGIDYLLMVALFWAYKKRYKKLGTLVFLILFLKLVLSGAEYLFSVLLLPFIPLVFYAVLNKISRQRIIKDVVSITAGSLSACVVAFLILIIQVSFATSQAEAIHHFINRVLARTLSPNDLTGTPMLLAKNTSLLQILHLYLSIPCISIGTWQVSFKMVILFFLMVSVLSFYLYHCYQQRMLLALLASTWASILCPLSWILFAKGHSVPHTFIDQLIWHMPFTLLGIALSVMTLQTALSKWAHE